MEITFVAFKRGYRFKTWYQDLERGSRVLVFLEWEWVKFRWAFAVRLVPVNDNEFRLQFAVNCGGKFTEWFLQAPLTRRPF